MTSTSILCHKYFLLECFLTFNVICGIFPTVRFYVWCFLKNLSFPWNPLSIKPSPEGFLQPRSTNMFLYLFLSYFENYANLGPSVLVQTQRPRTPRNIRTGFHFDNNDSAYSLTFPNWHWRFQDASHAAAPLGGALVYASAGRLDSEGGIYPASILPGDKPRELAGRPGTEDW